MTFSADMESILTKVVLIGRRLGASQVVLFGSRARGDNRARSDIDLAVFGLPVKAQLDFTDAIEQLPTLLEFDVVFVSRETDRVLLQNVERDGIPLMNKMREKYGKFCLAVQRLSAAVSDYETYRLDSVRDGVIQRFEFCTELAWKTVREYLLEQGYTEINSPKAVMKQAFADDLVSDGELWVSLLNDRNLTSHIYDEAKATEIFGKIASIYLPLFQDLITRLEQFE